VIACTKCDEAAGTNRATSGQIDRARSVLARSVATLKNSERAHTNAASTGWARLAFGTSGGLTTLGRLDRHS
jgi:hypothetical protein